MTATFTDPDSGDLHSAIWEWGDGLTSAGTVTEPDVVGGEEIPGSVAGAHLYSAPGVYTVRLYVDDNTAEGGIGSGAFEYVVVYDPDGGFVTGGGWITSPPGAYPADPLLTGKANFGFVAKYVQGAQVPVGTTEFRFNAAGLNFQSSSYQWLVVAGAKAKYKGVGTVNGVDGYGFMISAIDGQIQGGGGQDKFRMKIWEVSTEELIYDNQLDAPEDADPTTILGGGSIVIHRN
jgi:hypothetical protein